VVNGKPLIQRTLTVTGDAIKSPGNLIARVGTPFQVCVDACGGLNDETSQVFMGGPMMGLVQYDLQVPTLKATSGIVCMQSSQLKNTRHYPCIQCGTCVSVCPMNLVPTRLSRQVETAKYEDCREWGIFNCIECGSCAFVCPSGIPLVQWIRVGKAKSTEQQQKFKAQA
jgi:electron transport complex protein RnfC